MNLFANLEARLKAHLATMVAEGRLPEGLPIDRITVEPPRDASQVILRPTPPWCWQSRQRPTPRFGGGSGF